jgi:hypothetical protein
MVYPVCGLLTAVAVVALCQTHNRQRRGDLLRGALLAAGVCAALTVLLYLPILIVQGVGPTWETRQMTYEVWGPRVGSYANMLGMVWESWTRHAGPLGQILFPAGVVLFVISTLRQPTTRRLLPVIMIATALAMVWLQGAPLRSRAWLPALPIVLACAVEGIRTVCPRDLSTWPRRLTTVAAGSVLGAAALLSLDNTARQAYLCSEPDVLVNVEEVIDEWNDIGGHRCALVMRFTPAARYYRVQKRIAAPPAPGSLEAQRVLIVVETAGSLAEKWNESVDGYYVYEQPVLWRRLSHCTLYVAGKLTHVARADGQHSS